jgi:hypothetical protein
LAALTVTLIAAASCQQSTWPKQTPLNSDQVQALNELAARQQRRAKVAKGAFRGESWTVGSVPWNATILPLLSPDGRWIATSTGTPPSNAARMGLPGARPPIGSKIEIWEVLTGHAGIRQQHSIELPFVLTDSADDEGFLVESPQSNGSRWIGKVDWRTAEVTWLVDDDHVNAMPSIGPRGRLAWCVRERDEKRFSLAVRFATGQSFTVPTKRAEWLLPMWSSRSAMLSAWRLGDGGLLTLVSMDADSPSTMAGPARQIMVMTGANRWDAFKATANRTTVRGLHGPSIEQVIFYHPIEQRMAVWMPTGINADRVVSLAPGSIDALHDDRGDFLLTMPGGLHWQGRSDLRNVVRVDHVPVFARSTTDPMRPFLLLDPGANVVRLKGMRPRREAASADQ